MLEKLKRVERVSIMVLTLSKNPNKLFTLTHFAQMFSCAKSTLSEDMAAVRNVFEQNKLGRLEAVAGAAGGIRFMPYGSYQANLDYVAKICSILSDPSRMLTGGFIYTVDIFSNPAYITRLGEIFAQCFAKKEADIVLTVESKGIPIALMTAQALGVPLIVARKENRVTEGSVVTINYLSTSSKRLQTMSMPRRAVKEGQRALIIDDFVKEGGTVNALCEMMREFSVTVVGAGTLIAAKQQDQCNSRQIKSLMALETLDTASGNLKVVPSDWLTNLAN